MYTIEWFYLGLHLLIFLLSEQSSSGTEEDSTPVGQNKTTTLTNIAIITNQANHTATNDSTDAATTSTEVNTIMGSGTWLGLVASSVANNRSVVITTIFPIERTTNHNAESTAETNESRSTLQIDTNSTAVSATPRQPQVFEKPIAPKYATRIDINPTTWEGPGALIIGSSCFVILCLFITCVVVSDLKLFRKHIRYLLSNLGPANPRLNNIIWDCQNSIMTGMI